MKKLLLITFTISLLNFWGQNVNIPDSNLKNVLLTHSPTIDTNGDNEIQISEAAAFTGGLYATNSNINDATGIESFVNLTYLFIYGNNISSLDVSTMTNLQQLGCNNNQLTSLNISNNTNLTSLNCASNQLTSLDVSSNSTLSTLTCNHNQISTLTVSGANNLESILCYNNSISSLDISTNTLLQTLSCGSNQLTSLNTSTNTNLTALNCNTNSLSSLDLSTNINLLTLSCNTNQLTNLNTSTNSNLTSISCVDNLLTNITPSLNTNLLQLNCGGNLFSDIDLSSNINLQSLSISNNNTDIDSMDLTNNVNLTSIYLAGNNIKYLDLRNGNNTNITYIAIGSNYELYCVNVDDSTYSEDNWRINGIHVGNNTVFNGDCDNSCYIPLRTKDTVTSCSEYLFNGETLTFSGNYTDTLIATSSCKDSIVKLNLTILNSSSSTDIQSACGSYTWIDGNTYTSSNNTATYTVTNANGCDSIISLNLTILNSTSSIDSQSACGSYTWIDGNTYTTNNNTATYTTTNAVGCDSIITLDLTIYNSTTSTDIQSACDSYTWIDGNTYTSNNNSATYTTTNVAGCDSVITLNLIILNSFSTDIQSACGSYTWIDGNTYTADNNSATYTTTNAAGCDSIITLDLTILNSTTSTDTQSACGSYTWIDGNTYTANNNSATYTTTNTAGCDSTITLNLTIHNVDTSVTQNNLTLTANTTGAQYQWIECDNFSSLIGETNMSFTPTTNGSYAVEITIPEGCVDTSSCYTILNTSIQEVNKSVKIFPHPFDTDFNLSFNTVEERTITLYDINGKVVFSETTVEQKINIRPTQINRGTYILNIIDKNSTNNYTIVKH